MKQATNLKKLKCLVLNFILHANSFCRLHDTSLFFRNIVYFKIFCISIVVQDTHITFQLIFFEDKCIIPRLLNVYVFQITLCLMNCKVVPINNSRLFVCLHCRVCKMFKYHPQQPDRVMNGTTIQQKIFESIDSDNISSAFY